MIPGKKGEERKSEGGKENEAKPNHGKNVRFLEKVWRQRKNKAQNKIDQGQGIFTVDKNGKEKGTQAHVRRNQRTRIQENWASCRFKEKQYGDCDCDCG